MPKRARIHYVSLRSSLVNLPISIYGPLVERNVRPQHLAVHLSAVQTQATQSSGKKLEVYVGWTGMASASSLAHFSSGQSAEGFETVEIDPQYAQSLGLAQGDLVDIGLLHDLPQAKSVGTEPLTSDDWEIIEINASHVETTLLSQVRVAKIGQEVDVWVMGRTRVRLKIVSLDPSSKNDALLLTTNSEVSIAPKLHRKKEPAKVKPSNGSATQSPKPPNSKTPAAPVTPALNSVALRSIPSKALPNLQLPRYDGTELVACVAPSTFAKLQDSQKVVYFTPSYTKSTYKLLNGPHDPSAPATSAPSPVDPVARVLNPGNTQEKPEAKSSAPKPGEGEAYIGVLDGIPAGHIVFPSSPEGLEDCGLLKVSLSLQKETVRLDNPKTLDTPEALSVKPGSFLAGVDGILERCGNFCTRQFTLHSMSNSVLGFSGLLVTGRSGTGKTSIVQTVAKSLQEDLKTLTYVHYADASKLSETPIPTVKAAMNYWFDKCAWHKPSVLIIDNLDKLLSAEVEHADSFRSRHLTEIFLNIFSSSSRTAALNSRGIILIATADSTSSLHSFINASHVFQENVHVTPPNKDARRDILSYLVKSRLAIAKSLQISVEDPINFAELSTQTEGYSATDLKDLVGRALHQMAIRASERPADLTHADFTSAQVDFVPLSLRDVKLQKSETVWSDIGGLYETRRVLRETLEWPTKYGPIFKQSPLRLRSGLLLYGYPGCGKTLLASAVAKECGLNFISVKGPEILNKYIGASEKSVRDLFERASAAKPCVLFFDEFDAIAPKRGHDSTGVTDRVVNQMLTQMDGAEGLDGVYVLAATSRPDLIDSALLRPGRLDKSLLCNMPDHDERKDILQAVAKRMNVSSEVDFDEIASKTDGFSGADLQALLYNAHLEVIHSVIAETSLVEVTDDKDSKKEQKPVKYFTFGGGSDKVVLSKAEESAMQTRLQQIQSTSTVKGSTKVSGLQAAKKHEITQEHILHGLKGTRPSVSQEERQRLSRIYREFVSDRSGGLPEPPQAGGIGHRVTLA